MPFTTTNDGVELFFETTGSGTPIVFVHEFAATSQSWEPQVRHFSRMHQTITVNARGYPPSSVPPDASSYSQNRAVADILTVMDHLKIKQAHIVGLSMGAFATLHFGLQHPDRALSLCVAGCGYGAEPEQREKFRAEAQASANILLQQGMQAFVDNYAHGPTRVQFERADPRGFAQFKKEFAEHSALGSANTQLGVQRERPSLYSLKDELSKLNVPTLIVNGDEDWPCLAPGLMLKQTIPTAALAMIPNCGHTMNLEASTEFNHLLENLIKHASSGRWPTRHPSAASASITGVK